MESTMYTITLHPSDLTIIQHDDNWYQEDVFDNQSDADSFKDSKIVENQYTIHWDYPNDNGVYYPS